MDRGRGRGRARGMHTIDRGRGRGRGRGADTDRGRGRGRARARARARGRDRGRGRGRGRGQGQSDSDNDNDNDDRGSVNSNSSGYYHHGMHNHNNNGHYNNSNNNNYNDNYNNSNNHDSDSDDHSGTHSSSWNDLALTQWQIDAIAKRLAAERQQRLQEASWAVFQTYNWKAGDFPSIDDSTAWHWLETRDPPISPIVQRPAPSPLQPPRPMPSSPVLNVETQSFRTMASAAIFVITSDKLAVKQAAEGSNDGKLWWAFGKVYFMLDVLRNLRHIHNEKKQKEYYKYALQSYREQLPPEQARMEAREEEVLRCSQSLASSTAPSSTIVKATAPIASSNTTALMAATKAAPAPALVPVSVPAPSSAPAASVPASLAQTLTTTTTSASAQSVTPANPPLNNYSNSNGNDSESGSEDDNNSNSSGSSNLASEHLLATWDMITQQHIPPTPPLTKEGRQLYALYEEDIIAWREFDGYDWRSGKFPPLDASAWGWVRTMEPPRVLTYPKPSPSPLPLPPRPPMNGPQDEQTSSLACKISAAVTLMDLERAFAQGKNGACDASWKVGEIYYMLEVFRHLDGIFSDAKQREYFNEAMQVFDGLQRSRTLRLKKVSDSSAPEAPASKSGTATAAIGTREIAAVGTTPIAAKTTSLTAATTKAAPVTSMQTSAMTFGVVAFASADQSSAPSEWRWQQQPTVSASSSTAISPSSTSHPIAALPALSAPITPQASVVTSVPAPALTKPSAPLKWASALPSSSPSSPSHPIAALPASSASMASQAPVVTSVVGPPALALVPSVAASSLDGPKRKHETPSQQPPLTERRPQGSASAVSKVVENTDQQRTKTLVVENISSSAEIPSRPIISTTTQHPLPQRAVTPNTTSASPKGESVSPPPRKAEASTTASVGNMTLPLKSGPSTTNIASTGRASPVRPLATPSSVAPKATAPSPRALPAQTSVASVDSAVNAKPQAFLAVNSSSSSATTPAKTPMLISFASASTSSLVSATPPSPATNTAATTSRAHASTSPAASVAPASPAAPGNAPPRTARDIFQLHEQRLHALERSIVKLQQQQDVEQPDEHQSSRPRTSSQMDRLISQMKLHQSVQAKQNNFAKEMYESQRELNMVLKHFDDSMKDFIKMNSETKEFGKAQKKSLQDNLEIFNRELADLRAATLKQRIELEEMRQQSEARMREEAELEGTRYRVELQEQRIQTLEKDLESRRTEATLMMVKAREEIVASKEQVAKAREERAVAKEQAAQAEVEKLMLLSRIQQMEMYMMKMNVPPLSAPVTSSAATSADPPAAYDAAQDPLEPE